MTEEPTVRVPTIREMLIQYPGRHDLERALIEREDTIAEQLRAAGMQFGAEPALVAEVIAEIGLGTPPTPEMRALIHANFHARLRELEQLWRDMGGGAPA